ncbi:MAG: hypothetical protein JXR76_01675 [Deltaproteobacteria bacterium]|nr:hypothetical protein [Deltaproteobacteria bacterium]
MKQTSKVIIGLGTGRCGTVSLAALLNAQADTYVTHEFRTDGVPHALPWKFNKTLFDDSLAILNGIHARFIGDISFSNLPYVNAFLAEFEDVKFVIMKRDKQETIESYMRKTEGRNHWYAHGGNGWRLCSIWDDKYPKYRETDKRTAIGLYWEEYYERCNKLLAMHPTITRLVATSDLNMEDKVENLLRFIGFDNPVVVANIRRNAN